MRKCSVFDKTIRFGSLFLAVSSVLLLTASCAPFVTLDFYRPEAPDGKVVRAHCPPVNSFMLFESQGVLIGAGHLRQLENRLSIVMTFEIPEGKTVSLLGQTVELSAPSGATYTATLSTPLWKSGRAIDMPPVSPMIGKTTKRFFDEITVHGTTENAYYFLRASFTATEQDSFELKLPPFTVDNVEVVLPVIKFKRDSEFFWILSLNC